MPTIARGFDTASNSSKPLGIFGDSIEIKEDYSSSFNFHFSVFRTIADFRKSFRLNSEVGTPAVSSINLNAALEVSRSLSLDQDVLIYVMHVCGVRKRLTVEINESKFETDIQIQRARKDLHDDPYSFCTKYGDAFVNRILCGGEIALVIRFKRRMLERSKLLLQQLHINVANGVTVQQAITLLRDAAVSQLECDIYTQTKGFSPEQLPPADPQRFSDISAWLADFSRLFFSLPAISFETTVGYEVESYGTILPLETVTMLENTAVRSKYFFAIFRCSNAVDYYVKYFQWAGNSERLAEFQLKEQALAEIKNVIGSKQDMGGTLALQTIENLKKLIHELNSVEIPPRLVNEFTAADLGRNLAKTGSSYEELRISPVFNIPPFPKDLEVDSFMFEVLKAGDAQPLRGNLNLLYSFNSRVPFDGGSYEMARHINIGTRNVAVVPPLYEESKLTDLSFAYHLELRRSLLYRTQHFSRCLRPCLKTSEEDFRVRTYVINRKPGPIMPLT